MERYEYSILETILFLNGEHTGTLFPTPGDEYRQRLAWLRWRVAEGWLPGRAGMSQVEQCIRDLARSVVRFADRPDQRWRQEDL